MRKKELNLLPDNVIFDVNRHFLIKRLLIVLIFNIIFLLLVTFNFTLEKSFLNDKLSEQREKLKKISILVHNFKTFHNQYKELLKKLNYLNKKKELYYISNSSKYSSFLSFMVLANNIAKGIRITYLDYANGKFIIKGKAVSADAFYHFYTNLNDNNLIKKVTFYYLEQKDKLKNFDFKISLSLKEIA